MTEESKFRSHPKFRSCFARQQFKIKLVKRPEKSVLECGSVPLSHKPEGVLGQGGLLTVFPQF